MKSVAKHLLLVSVVALSLAGCSQTHEDVPDGNDPVFTGTPSEYHALIRACFEENGIETFGDPDSVGFAVDGTVDRTEVEELCLEQIGRPALEDLSEEELNDRYQSRVEQWECLADNGLVVGEPITFETFVDDYRRSDPPQLWEPTFSSDTTDANGNHVSPSDLCARDTF